MKTIKQSLYETIHREINVYYVHTDVFSGVKADATEIYDWAEAKGLIPWGEGALSKVINTIEHAFSLN